MASSLLFKPPAGFRTVNLRRQAGEIRSGPCKLAVPNARTPARHVPVQPLAATSSNEGNSSQQQKESKQQNPVQNVFSSIEQMVANTFNDQAPGRRAQDWKEVEGSWVLMPPEGRAPQAVVHFLGGAFVGAAPQVSYRLFLEALSNRDALIITTPYKTNFDHLKAADEVHSQFEACMKELGTEVAALPVYGVGHSLGGVIHLLICSRHEVKRAGNAFLAYNNRNATEVVPFLSPLIAPGTRLLGPVLATIAASPAQSTVQSALEAVRSVSPSVVRQLAPLVEQLAPLYLDVSQGREEFTPSPEEARILIRSYYSVTRNLMLRFKDDSLDESNTLASVLQGSPAMADILDLSVRTLPGDHLRPLQQAIVDLPPDVARFANNIVYAGGDAIGRLAGMATQAGVPAVTGPLNDLSRGVSQMASLFGGETGGPVTDNMQSLADEVAAWMGTGAAVISGGRALPAKSVFPDRPAFGARSPTPAL